LTLLLASSRTHDSVDDRLNISSSFMKSIRVQMECQPGLKSFFFFSFFVWLFFIFFVCSVVARLLFFVVVVVVVVVVVAAAAVVVVVVGCQILLEKKLEGMTLTLPPITRNFYVDGHSPEPH
jgi:hypothetical protein